MAPIGDRAAVPSWCLPCFVQINSAADGLIGCLSSARPVSAFKVSRTEPYPALLMAADKMELDGHSDYAL
jgi:hypothetical protein